MMFACVNDRYGNGPELYNSVDEFLAMCLACFEYEPELTQQGSVWVNEDGQTTLEARFPVGTRVRVLPEHRDAPNPIAADPPSDCWTGVVTKVAGTYVDIDFDDGAWGTYPARELEEVQAA